MGRDLVCLKAQRGAGGGRPGPQPTQVFLSSTDLPFQKNEDQRPLGWTWKVTLGCPAHTQSLASAI